MSRYILSIALLLLLVFPGSALSEESAPVYNGGPAAGGMDGMMLAWAQDHGTQWEIADQTAANPQGRWYTRTFIPAQHLTLLPEASLRLGYRFTGLTGDKRAAQYDYLHDSFAGGFSLHYHPLPFMVDIEFDYKNEYDHDAEASVAYSDMIKMDFRSMALFHNLDHMRLIAATDPTIIINPGKDYGVKIDENELKLVLKSPGRPYHLYVNMREFEKSGTIQQRWDPNFFSDDTASEPRDIDWITRELTVGINGNILGFLELDYHHTIKTFDSDLRRVLVDAYTSPIAATFAHNLVPDFETNEDVISIHTDQSMPLTASGTFSWGDKANRYSDAKVDFHRECGDISYAPFDNLLIAVKYGHQKIVETTPEVVAGPPVITPVSPAPVTNDAISTTRDKGVVSVSYHPLPNLGLLAEYKLDSVGRDNAKSWSSPGDLLVTKDSSITHTGKMSATYTPVKHTKIRASIAYSHNGDPSYNTDYNTAYEGYVWGTWVPTPGLTFNTQYKILRGYNPCRTEATDGQVVGALGVDERKRSVEKDNAGAGVSWFALDGLVLGANYDYLRMKLVTHLIFGSTTVSKYMPYWDTTHAYTVYGNYCFSFPLSIEADFSQSWSRSMFRHYDATILDDMDALTEQKIRETRGTVKANYEIWKGWGTSLAYSVANFKDGADVFNPVTGQRDGTAHTGTVLLTKKW